ncbi:MAG: membrane dipeptidase, partial [Alteriqipengyuania sp.]
TGAGGGIVFLPVFTLLGLSVTESRATTMALPWFGMAGGGRWWLRHVEKGGLTEKGRAVVRRMEELGMVVDIAHCSHACVADILSMSRRPVVSSHGGVQATCDVNRNLTDQEIRGVAKTGGVIGIGYWDGAVCGTSPRDTARAMKHVRDLVGIEHVALGSDYDGAVTVRFDTSQLVQVTQALMDEGFTEDEIRAAMGENALRVLREDLEPLRMSVDSVPVP